MGSAALPVSILMLSQHLFTVSWPLLVMPIALQMSVSFWSGTGFRMTWGRNLLPHCRLCPGRAQSRWLALIASLWETVIQKRGGWGSAKYYCAFASRAGVLSAASNGPPILRISADGESCGAANCTIAQHVAWMRLAIATALYVRHARRGHTMLKVMLHPQGKMSLGDLPSAGVRSRQIHVQSYCQQGFWDGYEGGSSPTLTWLLV